MRIKRVEYIFKTEILNVLKSFSSKSLKSLDNGDLEKEKVNKF